MGSRLPVTIDIMLNFDGDCDGDGNGFGKCKHTFKLDMKDCALGD